MTDNQIIENPKTYFWDTITTKDKVLFYTHLANLTDGGVTVVNAVKSFLEKTKNPKFFVAVKQLLLFVESGDPFHVGMKKLPTVFDRHEVAIVESGEQSGTMQKSFISLAEEL